MVLEAAAGAELLLGRDPKVSPDQIATALSSGREITNLLAHHPVQRGDVFDVPTGSLHALLPGLFIWEVQQPSDRTYRVADWGRDDPARPLHLQEAIRATDATHCATRATAIDWDQPGEQSLVRSTHFTARILVGPWTGSAAVGPHGAIATATGPAAAGGLTLGPLDTAHLSVGSITLNIPEGSALLIAEGR